MSMVNVFSQERDNFITTLAAQLPWSPFDYVREVSEEADKRMFAEHLLRPLTDENDLRSVCTLPHGIDLGVFCERLPWDSAFFGYDVARLNGIFPLDQQRYCHSLDYLPAVQHLTSEAQERGITYVFAMVDPRDLPLLRALCQAGFMLIESRCFYHIDLRNFSYPRRFPCREATVDDVELLAETASKMVNPFDRFHADPFINPNDARRLMERWVSASITEGFADTTIVPAVERPSAFCTVRYHEDKWERWGVKMAQPTFSAVSDEFRGWYLKIISEINYHLKERGAEHAFLSTQATNKAVIRVWEKLGFSFGKLEHVFRLVLD